MEKKYKHLAFAPSIKIEDVMARLEGEKGWEIISHSQTVHGTSVILKRSNPTKKK